MKKLCISCEMEVSFMRLSLGYLSAIAALYPSMVDVFNKPVSEFLYCAQEHSQLVIVKLTDW